MDETKPASEPKMQLLKDLIAYLGLDFQLVWEIRSQSCAAWVEMVRQRGYGVNWGWRWWTVGMAGKERSRGQCWVRENKQAGGCVSQSAAWGDRLTVCEQAPCLGFTFIRSELQVNFILCLWVPTILANRGAQVKHDDDASAPSKRGLRQLTTKPFFFFF